MARDKRRTTPARVERGRTDGLAVRATDVGADLAGTADEAVAAHAADADAHKGQKRSIEVDAGDLQLVGDVAAPGASKVYGTDGAGARGWQAAGGGGTVSIDPAGALLGDGSGGDPLAVAVDGVTIVINGSNELEATGSGGAHATTHQDGGADEIVVTGLSGELADPQPPKAHKTSHHSGGSDALALASIAGSLVIGQVPDALITLAKIANIATARFLGRVTAGAGVIEELTATQATAALNVFTSLLQGLVPASAGGTVKFLRADATWAAPPLPFDIFEAQLAGDVSTAANTTPVDVTGLVFNYIANASYMIEVFGAFTAPAATTGSGLHFDLSTAITSIWGTFFHQLANTGTTTGGSTIADDASVGVSSGIPTAAAVVPFYASFNLKTTGNTGTAQLRLRSETTAVTTIKAGTIMRVRKLP